MPLRRPTAALLLLGILAVLQQNVASLLPAGAALNSGGRAAAGASQRAPRRGRDLTQVARLAGGPVPPAVYAAALPQCQLQRQTLRGGTEALVSLDCRALAPGLGAPSLPVQLTQWYIQ